MILESSTENRMRALSVHRSALERQADRHVDDARLSAELQKVKELQEEMTRVKKNPRDHWVVVLKSRVVQIGAVGRVVYIHNVRNLCKIEFGDGKKVYCSLANVEVIDWAPLPAFVPMAGERVTNTQNGEEVVVVEWKSNEARVQPIGRPQDTYTIDRAYAQRKDSVIHM